MASILAPWGLRANYNTVGLTRSLIYPATSYIGGTTQKNYNTGVTFAFGTPVTLTSAGVFDIPTSAAGAATNTQIFGVFAGAEYVDSSGRRTPSLWFQDSFISTAVDPNVVFYLITDLVNTTFDMQFEAALTSPYSNIIGGEFNFSATAGRTPGAYRSVGQESANSTCALAPTEVGSGAQGQVRVLGLTRNAYYPTGSAGNYWNDAYPIVEVQIANTSSLTPKPNL